ncbi:phage tail assembly chaperone [Devosia aurantiaca]
MQGLLSRARTHQRRQELYEQLALPKFPEPVRYIWSAYWDIRSRRGSNGFGVVPITWSDIDAFARLTGLYLVPWEVKIITALDDLWLATVGKSEANK